MSSFFRSSIGKKLIMSITGLFLVVFIAVHLSANLLLLVGEEAFNTVVEFMGTNLLIKIMEPALALGFAVHILYSLILTLQNLRARGSQRYKKTDQSKTSTWTSRNMFVLGAMVFVFLALHLIHFFVPMKLVGLENVTLQGITNEVTPYKLVVSHFELWYYTLLYIIGAILLGLHLSHGFWSGFQTIGWSNDLWRKRLTAIGRIYAVVVALGFSIIPIYFLIKTWI